MAAARGRGGWRSPGCPGASSLPPDRRGVRTELAVDDGVASPRSVDLDEQPRRHLRRRRRSPARRGRASATRALETLRRATRHPTGATTPSAASRRPTTSRDVASSAPSSSSSVHGPGRGEHRGEERAAPPPGIVSSRSPRPSSHVIARRRSATAAARRSRPAWCRARSPAGRSGRRRVAGWRRHTSVAIHRRSRAAGRGAATGRRGRAARPVRDRRASARPRRPRRRRGGPPAATSSDITPMVRCDEAVVDGLGGVREARGRYRQSPASSVRSNAGSPSSSNVGIGDDRPAAHRVAGARQRLPHPPALAPVELEHEDVVEVEVQLEARGAAAARGRR